MLCSTEAHASTLTAGGNSDRASRRPNSCGFTLNTNLEGHLSQCDKNSVVCSLETVLHRVGLGRVGTNKYLLLGL